MVKHIACYSGGKDSTAMLILLKKHGLPLDGIIHVGMKEWEWNGIDKHFQKVEKIIGMKITSIDIQERINEEFKKYGFANFKFRWCTGSKNQTMHQWMKKTFPGEEIIQYLGIAFDEGKRAKPKKGINYPLVDLKITESQALQICYENKLNFNGVYDHHEHYNCWCCPLQKINELEWLFRNSPEKWNELKRLQTISDKKFRDKSILEIDKRFKEKVEKEKLLKPEKSILEW